MARIFFQTLFARNNNDKVKILSQVYSDIYRRVTYLQQIYVTLGGIMIAIVQVKNEQYQTVGTPW